MVWAGRLPKFAPFSYGTRYFALTGSRLPAALERSNRSLPAIAVDYRQVLVASK